jgi:hypothetical protein
LGVLSGAIIRANTLQITPEILNLIAGLDEFKGAWQALGVVRIALDQNPTRM